MAVLFPNITLGLQRSVPGEDAFGDYVPGDTNTVVPAVWMPGRVREQQTGTWIIGADPALWPISPNDVLVAQETGAKWVVRVSQLIVNDQAPEIDYVRVEANEVTVTGVEPGGPFDVGRRDG